MRPALWKKNGEILNEGKKHQKFTSTLKTYQAVDLYLCCEFCSILFPFGQVALGPACPKQGKQPRCTCNSRSRLQYKTSSQVKRKYEKIGLIRRLINVMLDRIEGIEISSGLGIKLSAAQSKPICHKLTAEETRKNFQREQVFACCIAYLIMCTENLAALYESSSRIWTASPSVFHAHPPFSNGTLLKCLHLIQVCTCVTDHSNKKLLLLKLTQLCMYLESDPLMHVHVYQANHCKIHPNCIRGSEDHPGLAMRLLMIYIFCCLLALSCWHFYSYSNNLSNIRYTCICSPKSMSSRGSIVISLKSKNVTQKKMVKRHHKIPTISSTSWAHLQTWRGRKGKAAGVESSTWRAKGWQLEESFRNVAREAGKMQDHSETRTSTQTAYLSQWKSETNLATPDQLQSHNSTESFKANTKPLNPATPQPLLKTSQLSHGTVFQLCQTAFFTMHLPTLCYNIVCVAQHNKLPFWCVSKDVAKVC